MPAPRVYWNTIARDIKAGLKFSKVKSYIAKCYKRDLSIGEIFQKRLKKFSEKVCLVYEDKEWTYQQIEDYSNQVANYFAEHGYQKEDEIALFMESRPEYVCIWLGLSKIGVVPAFINSNLRQQSLAHSINVINCKAIIFGSELNTAVQDAIPLLDNAEKIQYFCSGDFDSVSCLGTSLDLLLKDVSTTPPDKEKCKIGFRDKLFYVYTSGTTGMPKAAIIRHSRFGWIGAGAKHMLHLHKSDIFYNPLPLYHTSGGIFFLSAVLMFGGKMIIRKKFSASRFWSDAIKHGATVSQYIGETCRYLLAQPEKPEDRQHKIRLMAGNGLRPQIWTQFVERFGIKKIVEFYGSTEGNANVVNITGKVGAVGFLSRIFRRIHPVSIIRVDPDTGEPIRNEEGFCIRCKPGQPGEIIGKIIQNNPVNSFDGYANQEATKKKIIRNCFEKDDMAFLSGDILVMDENGYLYFMDRTGDTFRWKGENVATGEVESLVSKSLGLVDCVVYGVEVPGTEGRAGMVAIKRNENLLDVKTFYDEMKKSLPTYAIPLFIRICDTIEATGTYKLRKVDLQKEGFDPDKIEDPLYFLDADSRTYVKMDDELHRQIVEGKIRL